jgi:transposase
MSVRELKRHEVMGRVSRNEIGLRVAAALMEVSYRQAKRIWRRYRQEGGPGLVHRSAGRPSSRRKPKEVRERALALIREKYSGEVGKRFGPTLAAEHLNSDDGLKVHPETLRRWMLEAGLWSRERKPRTHRKRRERKQHFGELVQFDGSQHAWFEERGSKCFLMNMVDDATSRTEALFSEQETTWAAVAVLRKWVSKYGIPKALYTDWKNVYVKEPTAQQELRGEVAVTQFGRMCAKLGICIIAASSPQAKGRVERNHGTHQDRLIKKMRLKQIGSIEEGNRFLPRYLADHNRRYVRAPQATEDYHTPVPEGLDLDAVFRLEETRTISNDWVVSYHGLLLQLRRHGRQHAPARSKVSVCEWQDGRIEIYYREQAMEWDGIAERPAIAPATVSSKPSAQHRKSKAPPLDHPFKHKSYQQMLARKALQALQKGGKP